MKNLLAKLFSKEKVNGGRQYELDLAKGFTLLVICICHCILFLSVKTDTPLYYFGDIIGSEPSAPVFMVCLGIGEIYSKRHTPFLLLKKGILLLIGSFALNLYRSFPYWITGSLDYFACFEGFFVDDILQFAGLTFLLFALFKKFKMPSWAIFLVSVMFLITGTILMYNPTSLEFPKEATYVLNFFLPLNNDWCCFNLLTWFIYPSFGLVFGEVLVRCKDKTKFYLILLIAGGLGTIVLYLNIFFRFPNYTAYYIGVNFYRMGVLNSFLTICTSCFLLSLWYFLGKVLPQVLSHYLTFIGKRLTTFFVFTWIYLSPVIHIQAYYSYEFSDIAIIGMIFVLIILCTISTYIYRIIKTYIRKKKALMTNNNIK